VEGDDDWRAKSPDASRIGTAVEYLVAATCILASRGELNVSTALVDDEGVDLVFHRRGASATLAVRSRPGRPTRRLSEAESSSPWFAGKRSAHVPGTTYFSWSLT
jgi:hypothetical protein